MAINGIKFPADLAWEGLVSVGRLALKYDIAMDRPFCVSIKDIEDGYQEWADVKSAPTDL
jgi:hypothetical protein